jgi:hypothetical protein
MYLIFKSFVFFKKKIILYNNKKILILKDLIKYKLIQSLKKKRDFSSQFLKRVRRRHEIRHWQNKERGSQNGGKKKRHGKIKSPSNYKKKKEKKKSYWDACAIQYATPTPSSLLRLQVSSTTSIKLNK